MIDIFKLTQRPDKSLFYTRGDANDRKFGEVVNSDEADYDESNIVVLGVPQDEGVRRNKGRQGSSKAPDEIRRMFYKMSHRQSFSVVNIFDIGNLNTDGELEAIHLRQAEVVRQILDDGKLVIALGGGNDISYANYVALNTHLKNTGFDNCSVINIDSHFDLRSDQPSNSGTPFRQMIDGKILDPKNLYEVGIQNFANSEHYMKYARDKGVNFYLLGKLRKDGVRHSIGKILGNVTTKHLYFTFDLDVVRASDAPGVSASYPTGLGSEEIIEIAYLAGKDKRVKLIDFCEVNPDYDQDGRTTKLVGIMLWNFLAGKIYKQFRPVI